MANILYFTVERGTYALLNDMRADSVADAETSYRIGTLVADTHLQNAMWAPTLVRATILNLERIIASAICRTEGHARRVDFLKVIPSLKHGDVLPSSVGGIGSVYTESGDGTKDYINRRDPNVIQKLRVPNRIIPAVSFTPPTDYWGWDGARFFCTVTDPTLTVKMEVFDPDYTAIDAFTDYDAPFAVTAPDPDVRTSKLAQEFELAWACGAAGVLASKVGTFPNEASGYMEMFQSLMAQQGIKIKVPLDFAPGE